LWPRFGLLLMAAAAAAAAAAAVDKIDDLQCCSGRSLPRSNAEIL
jgi:hypothetical protein